MTMLSSTAEGASEVLKQNHLITGQLENCTFPLKHNRQSSFKWNHRSRILILNIGGCAQAADALSVSGLHLPAVFVVDKREQYKCCTGRAQKTSF